MKISGIACIFSALLAACGSSSEGADVGALGAERSDAGSATFSKELRVGDASGQNQIRLRVTARDAQALASYFSGRFVLEVWSAAQSASAPESSPGGSREARPEFPTLPDLAAHAIGSVQPAPSVRLDIIEERLATEVTGYRVLDTAAVDTAAPSYRAPFTIRYHETALDCVSVQRVSEFQKVYASIQSQTNSGDPWLTIASEVTIKNGDTLESCDYNSYKVRARVEARNTNDYVLDYHN
ncbi:MAG TPA: hypothetical protein VFQ61_12830 [Polyangiaceae bacterium]|nr:hypothetical protein [Polyangiaceae bacterium]